MIRRKVTVTAAAIFAIGVAFAAQPAVDRTQQGGEKIQQRAPWVPGTNMLMSAHELSDATVAPPR